MFVRWQLYRSQALNSYHRKHNDARARLKAVLVESVRIEGKPRQNHIAFLGSTSINGSDRPRFWYEVMRSLDRLGNRMLPQERQRIVAAISKRLGEPSPTRSEMAQFERERDQLMCDLR